VFGNLGTVGVAAALTCLMIFGIPGNGKLKPLGWWTTLFISMLAGSAYRAAGGLFKVVPDAAGTVINFLNGFVKGLTMPGLAVCFLIFLLWAKLTTKQVAVVGLIFFYVTADAGGLWVNVSEAIENARVNLQ